MTSTPTLLYIRSFRPVSHGHTVRLCFKKKEGKKRGRARGREGSSRSRSTSHSGSCRLFPGTPHPTAAAVGSFVPICTHPPLGFLTRKDQLSLCPVSFTSFCSTQVLGSMPPMSASIGRQMFQLSCPQWKVKGHIVCDSPPQRFPTVLLGHHPELLPSFPWIPSQINHLCLNLCLRVPRIHYA